MSGGDCHLDRLHPLREAHGLADLRKGLPRLLLKENREEGQHDQLPFLLDPDLRDPRLGKNGDYEQRDEQLGGLPRRIADYEPTAPGSLRHERVESICRPHLQELLDSGEAADQKRKIFVLVGAGARATAMPVMNERMARTTLEATVAT